MPTVALTVWGSRISPVFESASRIRLVHVVGQGPQVLAEMSLPAEILSRIALLREQKVSVLICGAISGLQASIIRAWEIELIPFVAGEVNNVIAGYIHGRLNSDQYFMPGCSGRHKRRRRRGRG